MASQFINYDIIRFGACFQECFDLLVVVSTHIIIALQPISAFSIRGSGRWFHRLLRHLSLPTKTNYLQIILCSVPWVEIHPSDAISLSFIQVRQNKISWDKFLQIPAKSANKISQQIWDWNIPRITPNTNKKMFIARGNPPRAPPRHYAIVHTSHV
jgi:hypothetical protein